MARPTPTSISCPVCGQPFNAILEQIIDVGRDPRAKERLLSGRTNLITCPHCGYQGMIGTPLMYHDPTKQLAIVFVPMELNLQQPERERLIGDLTNAVIRSLPEDAAKGYLLQPSVALTLQGLVDQVLEADGITKEVIEAERRKVDIINQLAEADSATRESLLAENEDLFDVTFLELLTAAAQAASQSGDGRRSLRLLNVREHLMETTEAGQEIKARQEALVEASEELKALGEAITREDFVGLLVNAAGNPTKVDALAVLGRPLLDYATFQMVTEHINATQSEEEKRLLTEMRERLLELAANFEQQSRAVLEQAANTLRMLLQASDVQTAVRNNLDRIDDVFLQVLQANLEEARRAGKVEVSTKLRQIRDEVLKLIQESAPPEIRLINELLAIESESEALEMLHSRQSEISEEVLLLMEDLAGQLREHNNELAAHRLDVLRAEAGKLI